MNKLSQLKRKQAQLEKLQQEVQSLEKSKDVQREVAFADELAKLLKKYGKTVEDITASPAVRKKAPTQSRTRKRRKLKTYINPHTKEKVETRGGNHNVLKAWKAEYGADEVESWVQG